MGSKEKGVGGMLSDSRLTCWGWACPQQEGAQRSTGKLSAGA